MKEAKESVKTRDADKCGNNKDGHTQHDFNEV